MTNLDKHQTPVSGFDAKEYNKRRDRQRYLDAKMRCITYLGGKCVRCGTTEGLQFDHIDPATKNFNITSKWRLPFEQLIPELDKCQLLCGPTCHVEKTWTERPRALHGTISGRAAGCRLDCCRKAFNEYHNEHRRKKRAEAKALKPPAIKAGSLCVSCRGKKLAHSWLSDEDQLKIRPPELCGDCKR